jgi:uncharacterized protein (TIGR03435 family)
MQRYLLFLPALIFAAQLRAQQPAAAPSLAYDVVSIKANHSGSLNSSSGSQDGYAGKNVRLKEIVADAYGIRIDLVSGGPGWLDSDRYDIAAKVSGDDLPAYKALTEAQRRQMLQAVLADRLHLVAHTVVKELPGYTLTIAKSGLKLKPLESGAQRGWSVGMASMRSNGMPMESLAKNLSYALQGTVLDQTGLSGLYRFDLNWDPASTGAASAATGSAEPSGLPALPTALEETLGLKLTPTRIPTTTLVIDSIARPTQN